MPKQQTPVVPPAEGSEPAADAVVECGQRLDKWLWYARVVKSRTLAAGLVQDGKVRVNRERIAKPSQTVRPGDVITVAVHRRVRVLRVVQGGVRRGPAKEAMSLYEDLSPQQGRDRGGAADSSSPGITFEAGAGRPTKRDRRAIDKLKEARSTDLYGVARLRDQLAAAENACRGMEECSGRGARQRGREGRMTYIVNENCIKCKYTDCVEVCPVDCFYEGANMLVIHPDECIDCGVCEPECPVDAIQPDTEPGIEKWLEVNREYADKWPNIVSKKAAPADADSFAKEPDKYEKYFTSEPGEGN